MISSHYLLVVQGSLHQALQVEGLSESLQVLLESWKPQFVLKHCHSHRLFS